MAAWALTLLIGSGGWAAEIVLDRGLVLPGSVVTGEPSLANTTAQPWVVLATEKACACTITREIPARIEPGASLGCPMSFRTSAHLGTEVAQVRVRVRAGEQESLHSFVLKATNVDYLKLPAQVVRMSTDDQVEIPLTRGGHPDRWDRFTIDAGAHADRFSVRVETVGEDWKAVVRTVPGPHVGTFRGRLTCSFFDGDRQLERTLPFFVSACRPGAITATPATVLVGAFPAGEVRETEVEISPDASGAMPAIGQIVCTDPARMTCTRLPRETEGATLRLRFIAQPPAGPASGEVLLHLDNGQVFHLAYAASVAAAK
jgi:hypothetical protein